MFEFELALFIYGCIPVLMSLVCLIMWLYIKFAKFILKWSTIESSSIPDEEKSASSSVSGADQMAEDIYDPEKDAKTKKEFYQLLFAVILGLAISIPLSIYLFF